MFKKLIAYLCDKEPEVKIEETKIEKVKNISEPVLTLLKLLEEFEDWSVEIESKSGIVSVKGKVEFKFEWISCLGYGYYSFHGMKWLTEDEKNEIATVVYKINRYNDINKKNADRKAFAEKLGC